MELWIRSQNETQLAQITGLLLNDNEIWGFTNYHQNYYELGIYKTKERALEILDEIQNILKPKCIINPKSMEFSKPYEENDIVLMDCNADARLEQLSTYVYEMPKE